MGVIVVVVVLSNVLLVLIVVVVLVMVVVVVVKLVLGQPSLEGMLTPWVNERESRKYPVLFVTNADKMAAALKDLYGQFLLYRVHFGLLLAL